MISNKLGAEIMSKKNTLIFFLLCMFMAIFFSGLANADDVIVELSMTDEADVELTGEMNGEFTQHLEHGDLLLNEQIIGNYRIIGLGYDEPTPPGDSIKSGELYFEVNGMGYLFMKFMTNSTTPDFFEGIINGGTGSLVRCKGTVSGNIPQNVGVPVPVTLHFRVIPRENWGGTFFSWE
jgi:hypothetical protein